MAYTINYSDSSKGSITVEDSTINQTTSLNIPGRNTTSYGSVIAESFLHLLENFAKTSNPANPVQGQLWYDSTEGVSTLKIYDGTTWVPAGGVKKGTTAPDVASALAGDLWSDTDNNQLYLFTGSAWILVGPEYSDGLLTGAKPVVITGNDEINYTVLQLEVNGGITAIFSTKSFQPKTVITGFTTIQPGLNLSTADLGGAGVGKFIGTSEKAENLIIAGQTVTASSFLRSDVATTADYKLTVSNNQGIQIGQDALITLDVSGTSGVLTNLTSGASLDFKVNNLGVIKNVIRVDSTEKVGINNISPSEALDVTGSIQTSANILVNGVTDSSSIGTGALKIAGGVGIAKKLFVGTDLNVAGTATTANVVPATTNLHALGTATNKWQNVYSTNFIGNLTGNVTGTITGRSGSTSKLATATTFQVTGDVTSNAVIFDGQQGGSSKTFSSTISNTFIANKTEVPTPNSDDEIIINRTSGVPGVYKITQNNLLSTVPTIPIGVMTPYGGVNAPAGWLLCDGTEVRIADYLDLFNSIKYAFKDQGSVQSGFFALPDMRGRGAMGADNMGGSSANRVTDVNADTVGYSAGVESSQIKVENLPEHEHDLRAPSGAQYYVIRDVSGTPSDPDAIVYDAPQGTNAGQAYPTSGGVLLSEFAQDGTATSIASLGVAYNLMNPYLTVNYIIYTGVGG